MRSRKFIPAKFLKGTIRESLYPRKLILAIGDRESLSPRKFLPTKVNTFKYIYPLLDHKMHVDAVGVIVFSIYFSSNTPVRGVNSF